MIDYVCEVALESGPVAGTDIIRETVQSYWQCIIHARKGSREKRAGRLYAETIKKCEKMLFIEDETSPAVN